MAFSDWVTDRNARCWCRDLNGTTGRWCRGCQQRWLWVEAIALTNDLDVAEDVARRSVAW